MIRQLKSIKQLEALLVADLSKDGKLANASPKVAVKASANPDECNWDVVEWYGVPRRKDEVHPRLNARVAELRLRYKAIHPK